MLGDQLGEVNIFGMAADHAPAAGDHHPVGAMRAAERERGDRILRAAEARLVERVEREIGLQAAEPSVAQPSARRGDTRACPYLSRASISEWRTASIMLEESLEAEPSTPRPTEVPAASRSSVGQMPTPNAMSEAAQWLTATRAWPMRAISSSLK